MSIKTIIMLTLPDPIPVGSSGNKPIEPWSGTTGSFSLASAVRTDLAIDDDDNNFDALRYKPDSQQTLIKDTLIGSGDNQVLMRAGDQISHFAGSIIRDTTSGNTYVVTFARGSSTSVIGGIVGGQTAIFITPLQPPGSSINLSNSFAYVGSSTISTSAPSIAYQEPAATCFASGTLIETDMGARAIETLHQGDQVLTRDHGFQPIRWIGRVDLSVRQLTRHPNLAPIRIFAGALAPNIPERDLLVSPQHRILIGSKITLRKYDLPEALVAAKHLTELPGIQQITPAGGVTYFHMLFDDHQVVLSNGAWSESLYTGPQAMHSLDREAKAEILALFPHMAGPEFRPAPARPFLKGGDGRRLARSHAQEGIHLAPSD